MTVLSRPLSSLQPRYDAIVVGSGYGGGVSASRLARAGKRVCVLERGREIVTGKFPSRFPEMAKELQVTGPRVRTGSPTALYDVRLGTDMHVLVGCGLGGGSLVNAGVGLVPDARVLADAAWPAELRRDGLLAEGYRRAERWLRPARHDRAADMAKFKALALSGEALGRAPVAAPVVVSFERTTNPAGIEQPACVLCGDCCGGCNVGAKNTVVLTYLPDAAAHGAEIFAEARVRHVARAGSGWRVTFVPAGRDGGAEQSVEADVIVLAAGTLGSTEILLRSRELGLALSDRLGDGFSGNGDIIAFGYGATPKVDAIGVGHPRRFAGVPIGACVSGQIEIGDEATLEHNLCLQEGVLPSALAPMLPMLFVPGGRILGALESLVKGVYNGPMAHLQTFFAVSHDSAQGRMRLDGDRLQILWPGAAEEPVFKRLDAALEAAVKQVGGRYIKNPLAGTIMGAQPATAHPLGGCRLGEDRDVSVVDHKGRVFDGAPGASADAVHTGLYVLDGAIMPRSLGVNPLLTITALAERAMLHLAADHGLAFDDAPRASNPYAAALLAGAAT